jgi:hypothetical protein
MSKFANPKSGLSRPRINAQATVVTSTVPVVRQASKTANTTNLAGGKSYTMSDKMEFVTSCFCWGMLRKKDGTGRMYESEAARVARIQSLIPKVGAEFAAKTALVLRILEGGRSISHILAAMIAPYASGEPWAADFYRQVAVRADDMCEIAAAIWKYNGKARTVQDTPNLKKMKLPKALQRGFAKRFTQLDEYRLAKYANKSANPTLRQMLMLCHAKPVNDAQSKIFEKLLTNSLVNTDTWEAQLSAAGQEGKSKGEAWASLVAHNKLGPLALLKNLRNIAENCSGTVVDEACNQLRDAQTVKNCGILPAQYLTAYGAIGSTPNAVKLKLAIDDSVEIAAGNVPSIGNKVLVCIDESGSMTETEREPAAIFAATLLKANPNADLMYFASSARYAKVNRKAPLMELMKQIRDGMQSGGTDFNTIFNAADKAYDTIVILSDNEGWMRGGAPTATRQKYVDRHGINPTIFSFDLGGDGSLMFREDSIITLAGYSFLVFKFLNLLKTDRTKMVDQVDQVQIGKPMPKFGEEED